MFTVFEVVLYFIIILKDRNCMRTQSFKTQKIACARLIFLTEMFSGLPTLKNTKKNYIDIWEPTTRFTNLTKAFS